MSRHLDGEKIVATAETLARRVGERFPASGLSGVAGDVAALTRHCARLERRLGRPDLLYRALAVGVTLALAGLLVLAARGVRVSMRVDNVGDLVQAIEALINDLVFAGIAVWFAFTAETRAKRSRALRMIGRLRSLAHVVDLHQLTKDPDRLHGALPPTASSPPALRLTPALLTRYLDYAGEMLAILGKMAALCVSRFNDPVTLAAVNDLEGLTTGLSQKIWQKIMIIDRVEDAREGGATPAPLVSAEQGAETGRAAPVGP